MSQACKDFGLQFGIYISPWDRNHPLYGTPAYNDVYINTMKEIFKNYEPLFELWWDGANGESPNGKKQVYDFGKFEKAVRLIAPKTVVFSDIGPDIRWVGNENGYAGKTNWNLLDTAGFGRGATAPKTSILNTGNEYGKNWIPAECDVSIRPGWFYHQEEDTKVKSPNQLFDLYLKSVGRGANLLLNVPPDRRGLINENDSAALIGFRQLREASFKVRIPFMAQHIYNHNGEKLEVIKNLNDGNIATTTAFKSGESPYRIKCSFDSSIKINTIVLQEAIRFGQKIAAFNIVFYNHTIMVGSLDGTTIGRKRILSFDSKNVTSFELIITKAKATPILNEVAVYLIDENLVEH